MFEDYRTLDEVRWMYERIYDLPAVVASTMVLLPVCDVVGAVFVPCAAADEVLALLADPDAPVILHPHRRSWVFLAAPDGGAAQGAPGVTVGGVGERVVLPLPFERHGFRWIREPAQPAALPAMSRVLDAVTAAA